MSALEAFATVTIKTQLYRNMNFLHKILRSTFSEFFVAVAIKICFWSCWILTKSDDPNYTKFGTFDKPDQILYVVSKCSYKLNAWMHGRID